MHGTSGTRLLYITPEKVARSDVLMRALNQLQQQHRLDRVVVDEAHCVSQVCGRLQGVCAVAHILLCMHACVRLSVYTHSCCL